MVPEAGREQVCNSIKNIPVTLQKTSQKLHKKHPSERPLSFFAWWWWPFSSSQLSLQQTIAASLHCKPKGKENHFFSDFTKPLWHSVKEDLQWCSWKELKEWHFPEAVLGFVNYLWANNSEKHRFLSIISFRVRESNKNLFLILQAREIERREGRTSGAWLFQGALCSAGSQTGIHTTFCLLPLALWHSHHENWAANLWNNSGELSKKSEQGEPPGAREDGGWRK